MPPAHDSKVSKACVLLLPERRRFEQIIPTLLAKRLGRADRLPQTEAGECAQIFRYFEVSPKTWPMAAITRQADVGDAEGHAWLRADPVHIRADINGARLMAWGEGVTVSVADAGVFIDALAPIFSDAGFSIFSTVPERWYIKLPRATCFPAFAHPIDVLGDDVFRHLPEGLEARSWRALLNEAQVILHNHSRNNQRISMGLAPVNSVWFWGGGSLPESIRSDVRSVMSQDNELLALAKLAGIKVFEANLFETKLSEISTSTDSEGSLIDLRHARTWDALEHFMGENALLKNHCKKWLLDFADGMRFFIKDSQRWRFWRRQFVDTGL